MLVEAQIQFCKSWYGIFRLGCLQGQLSAKGFFKVCAPPHPGFLVSIAMTALSPKGCKLKPKSNFASHAMGFFALAACMTNFQPGGLLRFAPLRILVSWFSIAKGPEGCKLKPKSNFASHGMGLLRRDGLVNYQPGRF